MMVKSHMTIIASVSKSFFVKEWIQKHNLLQYYVTTL